jgi:hypothetical protein
VAYSPLKDGFDDRVSVPMLGFGGTHALNRAD